MGERRLIQLADFDRPEGGSFVAMLRGTLRVARERGWRCEAAFFENSRRCDWIADFERDGVGLHFAPEELRRADRRLRDWIAGTLGGGTTPAVLHTHFVDFDIAAALAKPELGDVALVWHIHGILPDDPAHVARAAIKFGLIGRRVDAMLCPSSSIARAATRRLAPRSRVDFIPGGIEVAEFPLATADDPARAREQLGVPEGATALLHFGWSWKLKGGEAFMRAAERLISSRGGEVVALELGGGNEYVEAAERLGIAANLRVLDPLGRVNPALAAADVMVSSSRGEGMPYAMLESLCVGTPVVAAEINVPEADSVAWACRVTGDDPGRLAEGIAATLDDGPPAPPAEARDWIAERLSVEAVAERLVELYASLLAGRP